MKNLGFVERKKKRTQILLIILYQHKFDLTSFDVREGLNGSLYVYNVSLIASGQYLFSNLSIFDLKSIS